MCSMSHSDPPQVNRQEGESWILQKKGSKLLKQK
jgi:hypothetical protein